MPTSEVIEHKYQGSFCELKVKIKKSDVNEIGSHRHVQNIRNCDLFIEDYYLLIYIDVRLYKFKSLQRFDLKDIKNVEIHYNTKEHCMHLSIPCLPPTEDQYDSVEKSSKKHNKNECGKCLDLWKLKKITDHCYIRVDNSTELLKPESNFDYGFAGKFRGTIKTLKCDLDAITRIPEPDRISPLQRTIDREIDDMKNFCMEQYKLNFIELQVPEGHDNPFQFAINFTNTALTQEEQNLLHNLTCKPELMEMPDEYDIMEIDCGLISILLAICYDVRFTSDETNCESAWTRSVLSATLTYFEPFLSLKDVVISFMKSSLIYPLYRNYDLSKLCVEDCIVVLQSHHAWILKQLLITRHIFDTNERAVFNYYHIDDYIRYLKNPAICSVGHLQMLSHNLKNVLLDVFKKHLGLGLEDIETELLKEIISCIHIDCDAENDDSNYEVGTESCESDSYTPTGSENESSSTSDTEEDSVIEQKLPKI